MIIQSSDATTDLAVKSLQRLGIVCGHFIFNLMIVFKCISLLNFIKYECDFAVYNFPKIGNAKFFWHRVFNHHVIDIEIAAIYKQLVI